MVILTLIGGLVVATLIGLGVAKLIERSTKKGKSRS